MQEKAVIWAVKKIQAINPVLQAYRKQGMNSSLSLPADNPIHCRNLKHADAVWR